MGRALILAAALLVLIPVVITYAGFDLPWRRSGQRPGPVGPLPPQVSPSADSGSPSPSPSIPSATPTSSLGGAITVTRVLFAPSLPSGSGLLTNEWAYFSPGQGGRSSPDWAVTSGSLFYRDGAAWSGQPDASDPGPASASATGSAIFRMNTVSFDFTDVVVGFDLLTRRQVQTSETPQQSWDGVHVFLRYQSQFQLYYASVNRRDGHVVIKKKCFGGSDNGGTYYELGRGEVGGHPIPFGTWQPILASVRNQPDGSVRIVVQRGSDLLVEATDRGIGCSPITHAGAVGLRGDNTEFEFRRFTVSQLA